MRYKDLLVEVPVSDIRALNDLTADDSSWTYSGSNPTHSMERKLVKNANLLMKANWLQKIENAFSKTNHDYRIYFVNPSNKEEMSGDSEFSNGIFSMQDAVEFMPELEEISTSGRNSITIVLTGNDTDEDYYMPTTPWIVAHRFAHIIEDFILPSGPLSHMKSGANLNRHNLNPTDHNMGILMGIMSHAYDVSVSTFKLTSQTMHQDLIKRVFTMKSARDSNMLQGEFFAELFAQYLLTGKITFNPLPTDGEWKERIRSPEALQQGNKKLEELRINMMNIFSDVLDDLQGKVCIF